MTEYAAKTNSSHIGKIHLPAAERHVVDIKPRRMNFPFNQLDATVYFKNNAIMSAFGAALSGIFPPGETEFIESVRLYRDKVEDPQLLDQIRGFIGQEGHHSHQHRRANEVLKELGWDAQQIEKNLARDIARRNKRAITGSPKFRLAMTAGLEHLTAIMSEFMLTTPEVFEGLDPTVRELLFWHAVEEIEHKAVAFDLYMLCENDQQYMQRILRIATVIFVAKVSGYIIRLLWQAKKIPGWREIKEFYQFFLGKKGMITKIKKPYKDYFKAGFHPWDHDNQALIDLWKAKYYRADHDKGSDQYQADNG